MYMSAFAIMVDDIQVLNSSLCIVTGVDQLVGKLLSRCPSSVTLHCVFNCFGKDDNSVRRGHCFVVHEA